MIKITKEEYIRLKLSHERLARLESGGVDNWEHYGDSLRGEDDDKETMEDFEEKLEAEATMKDVD